ncbi:MAG: DSD1 family PLP-dependent enzyme [Candidatus Bathyarchaeota archaeon]|nr:DSD1 family PLP-dependent enzyme [Candidatus Bathyarchaeota archaeon]
MKLVNMLTRGISKHELITPALLIDLPIMEKNIATMAEYFKRASAELTPHIKTHKTPIIAHKQIEAGAKGIVCQTLSEAEVMAAAGIRNILVIRETVEKNKIRRLINLAKHSNVIGSIENLEVAKVLSKAALDKELKLNVAVEIDMGRCGVEAGRPTLLFVKEIRNYKGLTFKGIWCHGAGHPKSYKNFGERQKRHTEALKPVLATKKLIEDEGIPVEILSAGETVTYNITSEVPGVTEVQPGSYVFMDESFKEYEEVGEYFHCALTVLTTVISRKRDRAILDAGLKAVPQESGCSYRSIMYPKVLGIEGVKVMSLSEEHATLKLENPSKNIRVGDKLELIPAHCSTTVNLYDKFHGLRNGKLEVVWDIVARGHCI